MYTILVPTDFSPIADHGLTYAIGLCQRIGEKLIVLHATANDSAAKLNLLEEKIAPFRQTLASSVRKVSVEPLLEIGEFGVNTLEKIVQAQAVDLIIMGTEGRNGFANTFFGSHTSQLIGEVSCPVLVVPENYNGTTITSIGYTSDLKELNERLKEIVPFARQLEASIEIFHVYPVFPQWVDLENFNVHEQLASLRNDNSYEKISFHFVHTNQDNDIITGINEFMRLYRPDLLVMSYRERGMLERLFDHSRTKNMALQTNIPLLAFPQKQPVD
ncbi:MAG: universal stress protein [Ferruginibacter sp.]|nr:universal stress protein [Cytophagales bacterium]